MLIMKVAVGSKNKAKLQAVELAFAKLFPEEKLDIVGTAVSSGVSSQPMSDEESIQGATTRAQKALQETGADYGVGLEGGLHKIGKQWFDSGWIVVIDKNGKVGIGSSLKMPTAEKIMTHIHQGKELGDVVDTLFKTSDTRQGTGHFGIMSKGHVTRITGYEQGVIAALAPFLHPELFNDS